MSFGPVEVPPEFVLLRSSLLGDVSLKPGMTLNGRVLELFGNGRGFINLGGLRLEAQLPGGVRAGDVLRLRVDPSTDDRLMLRITDQMRPGAQAEQAAASANASAAQSAAAAAQPTPLVAFGLPGGAMAQVHVDPDDDGDAAGSTRSERRSLVLRYDSELLGRVDVVVRIDDAAVQATVLARPGQPVEAAREHSGALRTGLRIATDLPAQVLVTARETEPVDVRA